MATRIISMLLTRSLIIHIIWHVKWLITLNINIISTLFECSYIYSDKWNINFIKDKDEIDKFKILSQIFLFSECVRNIYN